MRLGYSGHAADVYARQIVMADMHESGEEDVIHRVAADLDRYASAVAEETLRDELHRFESLARDQLNREGWGGA